jgi:hypothetical protein
MKTVLHLTSIVLTPILLFISLHCFSQGGSELIFQNPVLESGTALRQGAIYRFSNVKTGVDAVMRLKRFSRSDIHMATIDNSVFGWTKAFQPEFGLPGNVAPNQNWFIDFEVTFMRTGTNIRQALDTVDFTALDVDGDGVSISEYVTYDRPSSIVYATTTALTTSPAGLLGSLATCAEDNVTSAIITCSVCSGSGVVGVDEHDQCGGSGKLHQTCLHAYEGGTGTNIIGPVTNFTNIDTSATLVMSVYRYLNRDRINFRYGARSGALSSSAGIRLNSMWFRRFNVNPQFALAADQFEFKAHLNNNQSLLKWQVATELNVYRFVIEKSTDGRNFSDIGIVFTSNSNSKTYEYTDKLNSSAKQLLYYRVRAEYQNGTMKYSNIGLIKLGNSDGAFLKLITYPNPVVNELRVTIPQHWQNKRVVYELFNANGQFAFVKEVSAGSQTELIQINTLPSGLYVIRAKCNGEIIQNKLVKN